jgi:ribosome maturation factor RimP
LTAADDRTATLLLDDGTERIVSIDDVDKARTVFEWGPKPKPGKQSSGSKKKTASNRAPSDQAPSNQAPSNKEKQAS